MCQRSIQICLGPSRPAIAPPRCAWDPPQMCQDIRRCARDPPRWAWDPSQVCQSPPHVPGHPQMCS